LKEKKQKELEELERERRDVEELGGDEVAGREKL
jgi:hypothetical protein